MCFKALKRLLANKTAQDNLLLAALIVLFIFLLRQYLQKRASNVGISGDEFEFRMRKR